MGNISCSPNALGKLTTWTIRQPASTPNNSARPPAPAARPTPSTAWPNAGRQQQHRLLLRRFFDLKLKVQTTNGKAFLCCATPTPSRPTYPDGAAVDYVRNAQGETAEVGVTTAGGTRQVLLGNANYYPFGPVAAYNYGNGRTLARLYHLDYRSQPIQDTRPGGLEIGFGFEPAGNLTALTPAPNTRTPGRPSSRSPVRCGSARWRGLPVLQARRNPHRRSPGRGCRRGVRWR